MSDAAAFAAARAAVRSTAGALQPYQQAFLDAQRNAEIEAAALAGNSVLHATVSKDYLSRIDAEQVVTKIANGELEVPRGGERIYVGLDPGVGPHSEVVVYRDQGRRTINIALPKGKVLARIGGPVCRWCAGLGIHPHLPERMRQILTMKRSVNVTKGVTNSTEELFDQYGIRHLVSTVTPGTNVDRIGVDANWPFVCWWQQASDLHEALPPFAELCCPRCQGEGF